MQFTVWKWAVAFILENKQTLVCFKIKQIFTWVKSKFCVLRDQQRSQRISLVICFLWYEPSQMENELIKYAVTQQLEFFFLNCVVSPVYVHPHHRRKTLRCSALIASTKAVELVRYDGHCLPFSAHSLTFLFFSQCAACFFSTWAPSDVLYCIYDGIFGKQFFMIPFPAEFHSTLNIRLCLFLLGLKESLV